MKATLTFDLDDHEDQQAHLRCIKATKMAIVLFEIEYNLRKKIENRLDQVWDDHVHLAVSMVFEEIEQLLDENDLNIDTMIE